MGNDNSRLKGLIVNKKSVEVTQFWTLNDAELPSASSEHGNKYLSIFREEPFVDGKLWSENSPIARVINNLKIYRHPHILRYVNTWVESGQKFLATERVRPLAAILGTLSDVEICIGIRSILCSLIFLVEKAKARHLNICVASIYVTDNGAWRLAGFEYVWKAPDVTNVILQNVYTYREKTSVDPNELKQINAQNTIEQYALGNMCQTILEQCTQNKKNVVQHLKEFCDFCASQLKNPQYELRPKLSDILLHSYFNNDLVLIHSFLFELPAKSLDDKQNFFKHLIERLRQFDENVIGKHLAADLISHMVLLDATAQVCVTPYIMKTKTSDAFAIFSPVAYIKYMLPQILKMFRIRDAQIRIILLEYFLEYVSLLDEANIRNYILPHLEAGMDDVNDILVSKTMHCLADLVPILGAEAVIGGERSRIFSDGRPCATLLNSMSATSTMWKEHRSISPIIGVDINEYMVSNSPVPQEKQLEHDLCHNSSVSSLCNSDKDVAETITKGAESDQLMPPRMSPDGGEDESCFAAQVIKNLEYEQKTVENINDNFQSEVWSDWEDETEHNRIKNLEHEKVEVLDENKPKSIAAKIIVDDLSGLDLQVRRDILKPTAAITEEVDYFKDMEPDIIFNKQKTENIQSNTKMYSSRLTISHKNDDINDDDNNIIGDGWIIDSDDELNVR